MRSLGVLISGRGSNLCAIQDAIEAGALDAEIALVVSNRESASGLQFARERGLETVVLDERWLPSRDRHDRVLADTLTARRVELICLAGYMRLVTAPLLDAFPRAVLNIHPSLLPAFPGLHAPRQALAHGAKVSGATVHFVDAGLDSGPIVLQAAVPVLAGDSEDTLAARILAQEHRLYPEAIRLVTGRRWRIDGRRFVAGDEDAGDVSDPAVRIPRSAGE